MAKVEAVKVAYPALELIPLVVTPYARPKVLEQAQAQGVIIIQSFER